METERSRMKITRPKLPGWMTKLVGYETKNSVGVGAVLLALLGTSQAAFAQGSDLCAQAQTLPLNASNFGRIDWNTQAATNDALLACSPEGLGGPTTADVWFNFQAPASGVLTFYSYGDSHIGVFGVCGGPALFCSTFEYPNSRLDFPVVANQTYKIAVQNYDPDCGGCPSASYFFAAFSPSTPPSNDTCDNASVATVGTNRFDNRLATTGPSVSCPSGTSQDVWFRFVAPQTGPFRFRIDSNLAAVSSGALSLYNTCQGSEVACSAPTGSTRPSIDYGFTTGQAILVRVSSRETPFYPIDNGPGSLIIEPTPVPVNDTCAGAIPVTTGATLINSLNTFYNSSPAAPCAPGGTDGADIWFSYTAPATGAIQILISQPSTTLQPWNVYSTVAAYSSCGGNVLGCGYGFINGSRICPLSVVQGQTYLIRVASYGSTLPVGGYALLNISAPIPVLPANTSCQTAQQVGTGDTAFNSAIVCGPGSDGLFYRYTNNTTGTRNIRVRTCGSSTPSILYAYSNCTQTDLVTSNGGGGCGANDPNGATVRFCLQAGESMIIELPGGSGGPGTLNILSSVPATNDSCASAISLIAGNNTYNTTLGCGIVDLPCRSDNTFSIIYSREVWYKFSSPVDASVHLTATNTGSRVAALTVRESCGGPIMHCCDGDRRNEIIMQAVAGQQYFVSVSENINDSGVNSLDFGTGRLRLEFGEAFTPPADAQTYPESCVDGFNDGNCSDFLFIASEGQGSSVAEILPDTSFIGNTAYWESSDEWDGYYFDIIEPGYVRFIGQTQISGEIHVITNTSNCNDYDTVYQDAFNNTFINSFDTGNVFIPVAGRHEVWLYSDSTIESFRYCSENDTNYWIGSVCIDCGPVCNDIDFNNDGSTFDPTDIDALLSVFSEGPCVPASNVCDNIDFNNDGASFDPCDIDSFLIQFSEGPCTSCGV